MGRRYSEAFLRKLADNPNEDGNLGITLAKTCVQANLPLSYVAVALGVSKVLVFRWFRGGEIAFKYRNTVHAFISLVERDMRHGQLPAMSQELAKIYIQEMIGRQI